MNDLFIHPRDSLCATDLQEIDMNLKLLVHQEHKNSSLIPMTTQTFSRKRIPSN